MTYLLDPFRFVVIALSGWMNERQSLLIDYLREENRVLREQLGQKRLRFTDDQRRRLAHSPTATAGAAESSELIRQVLFSEKFLEAGHRLPPRTGGWSEGIDEQ
jgi:hypothetical protein